MLSTHDSGCLRVTLFVVVGLVALSGLSVSAVGPATTVDQTAPPTTNDEHTLVIETTGEPVQYTLTVSGRVSGDAGESDTVQGRTLNGRIGVVPWDNSTNDTQDTVTYTGYIETFQHRGDDIQLFLDGEPVSSAILSAEHLMIVHPNSSTGGPTTPINYEISVTGDAIPGESTENQDGTTAENGSNGTLIEGQLSDQSDMFYFTGNTTVRSFDSQASVFVNGRNITVSGAPNDSPQITVVPPTATDNPPPVTDNPPPATMDNASPTAPSASSGTTVPERTTTTLTDANESGSAGSAGSSGSVFGFLLRLATGVVMVALVVTAAWYWFPRQQRW